MKAAYRPGHRYRVRFKLPTFIEPKMVLAALKRDISDVILSNVVRGTIVLEATWRGASRVIDSEFILESVCLGPASPAPKSAA